MRMKLLTFLIILMSISVYEAQAEDANFISQQKIDESEFYLLDAFDKGKLVVRALETYKLDEQVFVPITPLFEGFRLRYTLTNKELIVYKGEEKLEVVFNSTISNDSSDVHLWYKDEYYTYISLSLIAELFDAKVNLSTQLLRLSFDTGSYDFPYKLIEEQNRKRSGFIKATIGNETTNEKIKQFDFITIEDEYRLFTQPTGYIDYLYGKGTNEERYNLSTVLVSDFLYHSTTFIYNENNNSQSGRLTLSRYRSSDNKPLLGYWDSYSFGDIYTVKKQIDTSPSRGFGISFSKNSERLSRDNMTTSFYEEAPAGWEAEIFHNNVYLETRTIPDDGILEFDNIELYYGVNQFKILLFGPFGEEDVIYRKIDLRSPKLAANDSTLTASFTDSDFSWSDGEVDTFNPNANINYTRGITNWWSLGSSFTLTSSGEDKGLQSIVLDNTFNLPNLLIENDLSLFKNGGLSQQTTLATSLTGDDSVSLRYRTNGNTSGESDALEQQFGSLSYASYFGSTSFALAYNFTDINDNREESYFNRIATSLGQYYISNTLRFDPNDSSDTALRGNINLNGRITDNLRASFDLPYLPDSEEPVNYESAQVSFDYKHKDENDIAHSTRLSVSSIFEDNRWQATYNVAWKKPTHQFYFRSTYNYNDSYLIQAGIKFFFGYDNANNRPIFSSDLTPNSGTLDIHAYLDRYINGVPDALDYDLEGVVFSSRGSNATKTSNAGKARLFGLNPGPNYISANWENGAKTYTNRYVVFSHPGSSNSANVPFYLNSEFESFVYLNIGDEIIPVRNAKLTVTNKITNAKLTLESDIDGYIFSDKLTPGSYKIEIDKEYLQDKSYTADVIGYEFQTSLRGGFIVIPEFVLSKSETKLAEQIPTLKLDESNSQSLVENDKLMHLPQKYEINAPFSLNEDSVVDYSGEGKLDKVNLDLTDVNVAKANTSKTRLGLTKVKRNLNLSESKEQEYSLYVGEYRTLNLALEQAVRLGKGGTPLISGLSLKNSKVYRFNVANFNTRQDAIDFVNQNYAGQSFDIIKVEKDVQIESGWVIQFAAKKDQLNFETQLQALASLERLYIARKLVNGDYWNCLISHVFPTKSAAEEYLKTINISGFAVPSENFTDTIWSKYQ
ncbi:hypothetical protein [uncultured Psychrosphaera sp.]|uniref:hypothetical protein n=1 Tax=uncultured Psychrosphaera sp. TaxID=1403522 RepID=UPI0030F6D44E